MPTTVEKAIQHVGETRGSSDPVHDLIQTLSRCLNGLWRYDQYIANADGKPEIQDFWRKFKKQEQASVKKMKDLLCSQLSDECGQSM